MSTDAGPARHDVRDVVRRHGLLDHPATLAVLGLGFGELLLQLRDPAIGKLARALELALALRDGEFVARLVELALEVGREPELLLLGLPLGGQRVRLFLEPGELLSMRTSWSFDASSFSSFSARFDLELHDGGRSRPALQA